MNFDPSKISQMMQQAQSMQQKMLAELENKSVEAQAGGGMVTCTMNGAMKLLSLKIDPAVVDKDDLGMLEDLVRAAVNDATFRVEELRMNQAQSMAGQLGLPTNGLF
jgi:nucleoid-associated protein EbfC